MDFHSIIGKLRGIESLGTHQHMVAEETSCNMTAEGTFCPVHGMSECAGYGLEECNMTAEGTNCPTHGLAECPGYVVGEMKIDPSTLDVREHEEVPMNETNFTNEVTMTSFTDNHARRADDMRAILDTVSVWNKQNHLVREDYDALGNYFPGNDDPQSSASTQSDPSINWAAGQQMPIGKKPMQPKAIAKAAGTPTAAYEPKAQAAGTPTAAYEPKTTPDTDDTTVASKKDEVPDVSGVAVPSSPAKPLPHPGQTTAPTPPATAGASPDSMSFKDAFAKARKAAGGGQGIFTWKGKQYQTNVKGEPFLPPNKLKPVQISEADISAREPDVVDPLVANANADFKAAKSALIKGQTQTADRAKQMLNGAPTGLSIETDDDIYYQFTRSDGRIFYIGDESGLANRATNTKLRTMLASDPVQFSAANKTDAQTALNKYLNSVGKNAGQQFTAAGNADDPRARGTPDEVNAAADDAVIQFPGDPKKYVRQADGTYAPAATNEDVFGAPFAPLGATNNGPETDGYVYANFTEGLTINTTRDMRDGKVTKTLNITATDEDAESLAALLRNAGLGMEVMAHKAQHGMRCDGCGLPAEQCHCAEAMMENADHDYGHVATSEVGEPVKAEDYIWDGPHINQRFGKIGDNTLMYEQRAGELFKTLSEDYAAMLNEAELEPSNAGFDSPLTANSRDSFDKDPFSGDEAVTDGSHSPLSTIKRQDVMN